MWRDLFWLEIPYAVAGNGLSVIVKQSCVSVANVCPAAQIICAEHAQPEAPLHLPDDNSL